MANETTTNELIRSIETAFGTSSRPEKLEIVREDSLNHVETNCLRTKLFNKNWIDICDDPNSHHGDDLAFISPDALSYFLPGYMILCVRYFEEMDILVDNLVDRLSPVKNSGYADIVLQKLISEISEDQSKSIVEFLKFVQERWSADFKEGVNDAIDYWQILR